jgi:N-acyl-D-amino-acid deacylase
MGASERRLLTTSRLVGSLLGLCLVAWAPMPAGQTPPYDLVIAGGRVVDGTGAQARRADVAIKAGRIVEVGDISGVQAADTIDASGLIVAPGFIDVHTHADDLAEQPRADNFVRMGVTTIVAGNCGSSSLDISKALTAVEQAGPSVNFAILIGHNTIRSAVMGTANRNPTIPELDKMKAHVWRAMADGAVGFSTGLQYVPGTYSKAWEVIELARIAGNGGGVYASHMRNEGTALEEALSETIRAGELAGARVQISHLKVDSPSRWGASAKALALIDAARARGVAVQADQYAYTAASSTLGIRFPSWVLEGGQSQIAARLTDAAMWPTIKKEMEGLLAERGLADLSFAVVASYRADPALNGLSMKQVAAKLKGADTADSQFEAAREMMLAGGASMVYHFMADADVDRIMKHPQVGIASDSSVLTFGQGAPHPRGYGNNARVLGEYVRTRKVLTLEEAVRKMTSLPATQFRFTDRGRLAAGYAADIVIFDAAKVGDAATFEKPHTYPHGIPHVIVNGVPVVRNGEHTGAKSGKPLTLAARREVARPGGFAPPDPHRQLPFALSLVPSGCWLFQQPANPPGRRSRPRAGSGRGAASPSAPATASRRSAVRSGSRSGSDPLAGRL